MKKLILFSINSYLCLTFLFPLTGCGFRHLKSSDGDDSTIGQTNLSAPASFSQIQAKIIAPKCLQCHSDAGGNQGSVNLESYDQVVRHLDGIKQKSLIDQTMPPSGPLSVGEKGLLKSWITSGAPLNENGTGESGQNTTRINIPIKWQRIKNEIIDNHCLQCHSPPTTDQSADQISTMEAGLDLTSLAVVREKADLIFKRAIILSDMPLQPYHPLNAQEKALLTQWMIDGMQEDPAP
jgi:uncharacterized membrane protein